MNELPDSHGDLAGAYVLDALDPEELEQFQQHLAVCEKCQLEVAELRQVVIVLPLGAAHVEPPAPLKSRLLDAISTDETDATDAGPSAPVDAGRSGRIIPMRRRVSAWTASLGVAAAVIIAALGIRDYQLQQNSKPQATGSYAQIVADLASHGGKTYPVPGTKSAPSARGTMIQPAQGQEAYLVISGLSAAPSRHVYQLWLMRGGKAYSAATFGDGSKFPEVIRVPRPVTGYRATGVTVEPGPHGSRMPTGPQVLAGRLAA